MSKTDAIASMTNSNLNDAKNKCRALSEEEKNIKREYGKKRYHSMSEEN